jgi:Domain of unknown function DUF29
VAEGKKHTQTIQIGATAVDESFRSTGSAPVTTTTAVRIDDDFYGWLLDQASALQRLQPDSLDWRNLAEELEAMSRSEEDALESYLVVLLKYLLKCRYQPGKKTSSWEASIENSRERITRLLKRSPSLNSKIDEIFRGAYSLARRKAGAEMRLEKDEWDHYLPLSCEWTLETVLVLLC